MTNKKVKIVFNSPVILSFVVACFIATTLGVITEGNMTEKFFSTYHTSLKNPMTYLRFFTYVFGHDGWNHFIGNTSYILLLGPMLEEKYGSQNILAVIEITAITAGLVNYIFFWNVSLCGASGIVFAFILLASFTSFREGEIPLTFIFVAIIFIGQQICEGISLNNNISYITHIIGGIVGTLIGYHFNRKNVV